MGALSPRERSDIATDPHSEVSHVEGLSPGIPLTRIRFTTDSRPSRRRPPWAMGTPAVN